MAKVYLVLAAVCLVALTQCAAQSQQQEQIKRLAAGARKRCLAETGADPEVIEKTDIGYFPEDRKLACYMACILERFNMLSKKGQINFNLLRKIIPEEYHDMGNDMIDECLDVVGTDNCDLAFNFNKCLFYANPVAYFSV